MLCNGLLVDWIQTYDELNDNKIPLQTKFIVYSKKVYETSFS